MHRFLTQKFLVRSFAVLAAGILVAVLVAGNAVQATPAVGDPAVDDSLAPQGGTRTAVLSGGCFWGMQLLFQHVKGVINVTAGYSGGSAKTAEYETVSGGGTGHAESVSIVYDPSKITYGRLLKVFFAVGHDPTELNRQGPDYGTQYRSVIFYADDNQLRIARAYIEQLDQSRVFSNRIVTQLTPLEKFYPAEPYHQNYAVRNPGSPYIMVNDLPKVDHLRERIPDLYK
jgi:peptide-methionine (S)-S-oxide reductase